MSQPIRLLVVEDSSDDAGLVVAQLTEGGFDVRWQRVETASAMTEALEQQTWDAVISDYRLPTFGGLAALQMVRDRGLDYPFILVSGTIGEEMAVEAMKAGAHDYLMKGRLTRLAPALRRELADADARRIRRASDETARRLLTAIEQSPESIVITDAEARIRYVNPAFERNTGYSRDEALGQNPRFLKSGRQDAAFYRKLWDTITAGQLWHGRFVNKRKDGSLFTEDAIVAPVHDPSGTITHYVATKRDVTRELQLEEQFYHSQRMEAFGQLAGGVAHDFNNILAVILMHLSLLERDTELSPKVRGSLDELMRAAQRAAGVTRQLLVFSRRQAMEVQTLDLNRIASGLTKMLRRLLGENIELVFEASNGREWIEADAGMIEQVIMNLCVNARDAMPEGGRLTIRTGKLDISADAARENMPAGPYVCLAVSDTGSGMDAETMRHMFEPFFTTKPVGKGTGLGLATVYGIVRQHHGWVEVESVVGHGSTFRVFLPFSAQAGLDTQPTIQSALPHGHERILLVEDDESVRRATALCLSECGYQVTEARTGVEALQLWEEHGHEFDVLLTDVTMPGGISGIALAEQLHRAKDSLKVIMVSGYNRELQAMERLPPGSVFLPKPVELLKLLRAIRDCLDACNASTQSPAN